MNREPLVSILMTVYNREKYISEAIESVMASTYRDWELIIVDDQSLDRSVEIAKSYAEKDNRIKVYVNEKNLGDYPNRNKAASYAKGKYLKYLDSDDIIYPCGLQVMVDAMKKYPDSAFGFSSLKIQENKRFPIKLSSLDVYRRHFRASGFLNAGPSATIIRTDVFKKENGFREIQFFGDTELWLRLACKYPVVVFNPGLIWWREHEEQQIKLEQNYKYVESQRFNLDLELLENAKMYLSEEVIKELKENRKQNFSRRLLSLYRKGKFRFFWQLYKHSDLNFKELFLGFKGYK